MGVAIQRVCVAFCRDDAGCAAPERCLTIGNLAPQDGLCIDPCTPWGSDCPTDMWCNPREATNGDLIGTCTSAGPQQLNQDCTNLTCGEDLVCLVNNTTMETTCYALCDDTHPCATGTCTGINGLPTQVGACLSM
jgi:hypothetical protein